MSENLQTSPPNVASHGSTGTSPVMLDRRTAERMATALKWFERQYKFPNKNVGLNARGDIRWTALARVTTTMTSASGAAYGTGVVTFLMDNGGSLVDDTTMTGIPIKNFTVRGLVAGSTAIVSLFWALGSWWFDGVYDCAALS